MLIREALPGDAAGIARVQVDSWRTTYAGLVPAPFLEGLSYDRCEETWQRGLTRPNTQYVYVVAENSDGQVVGFANGGPERDGRADYQGELYTLYLLQDYQRQGLGRGLVAHAAQLLRRRGYRNLLVWVLAENPSRRFYEALGGVAAGEKPIDIGGAILVEVAYGWSDIRVLGKLSSA